MSGSSGQWVRSAERVYQAPQLQITAGACLRGASPLGTMLTTSLRIVEVRP